MKNVLKEVYDDIYLHNEKYNFYDEIKNFIVDVFCSLNCGKVLDIGCGEGIHLKRILSKGLDAFGVELSSVCCQKYLQGIPHKNTDILTYSKEGHIYENAICMDVLEHIPYEQIEINLEAIRSVLSPKRGKVLFCIANHSDIQQGHELHLIQEKDTWWKEKLSQVFPFVHYMGSQFGGRCFYFICSLDNSLINSTNYCLIEDAISRSLELNQKKDDSLAHLIAKENKYLEVIAQIKNQLLLLSSHRDQLAGELKKISELNSILTKKLEAMEGQLVSVQQRNEYLITQQASSLKRKELLYILLRKTYEKNRALGFLVPKKLRKIISSTLKN